MGPSAAGRGTNINTKPPVNKAAGRVPATPEQVCEMPPCGCLALAAQAATISGALCRPCVPPRKDP